MPKQRRPHRVEARFTDSEHAALAERAAAAGVPVAQIVRDAVTIEPTVTRVTDRSPATREHALGLLADAAASGSVVAMVALAREMRLAPLTPAFQPGPIDLDEIPLGELRSLR